MATSQILKVEANVHINASAEQFHDVFCKRTHHIANILPQKVKSVEIHKGEWGTEGSIICWNYLHDGKVSVAKEVVEDIDKENNKMNFRVIDGDILKHYKSFKLLLKVTPKEKGSVVNWVLEYEKKEAHTPDPHTPDPHTLMELVIEMSKEIGAHLTQNNITK